MKSLLEMRKKLSENYLMISTSYHEAGHTLYGLAHYRCIQSVELFTFEQVEGITYYDIVDLDHITDSVLFNYIFDSEIGTKYAGLIAEKYYYKYISGSDKFPMFLKDGSNLDTKEASDIIKKYSNIEAGAPRSIYKKKIQDKVKIFVKENWEDIVLVAHAIFNKKMLSYLDLKNLLCKKSIKKDFWKNQFKRIDHIYENTSTIDDKNLRYIIGI